MLWKFEVIIKDIYSGDEKSVVYVYSKYEYTWHEAWNKCVNAAISNCLDGDVVYKITSLNTCF